MARGTTADESLYRAPVEDVMPLARPPEAFAPIGAGKVTGKPVTDPSIG